MITSSTPVGTSVVHPSAYGQGTTTSMITPLGKINVRFADVNGRPLHLTMWALELRTGVTLGKLTDHA